MENLVTAFANFFAGGLLLLIGLVLRFVQGSEGMIAGYNTMGKEEQAKWNPTEMRMFLGRTLMVAACVLLLGGVVALLGFYPETTVLVSWGLFIAILIFLVIYVNASSRFRT